LLADFINTEGLDERPLIKEVIEDLVQDVQGARLRDEVLPLDRFAQSEIVNGRPLVTINKRIAEMPRVKDPAGVRVVAIGHEAVHVDQHLHPAADAVGQQLIFSGLDLEAPQLIMCRSAGGAGRAGQPAQEFMAENAALAMTIALPDLQRCAAFAAFQRLAADGGDLGAVGWTLLYRTAEFIGVNATALVTYFTHRGLCYVERGGDRSRLMAAPRLFEVDHLLEPVTWTSRSAAS
jgi:hypothetical protein